MRRVQDEITESRRVAALATRTPPGQNSIVRVDRAHLKKENEQLEKVIANSRRQLTSEAFISKAPAKVIESMRAKLAEYESQLKKNRDAMGE